MSAGDSRVYDVVEAPSGRRYLVQASPRGVGTLDRPGKWMVWATPFPPARLVPKWRREGLDRETASLLATTVIQGIESGQWAPGQGEPDQ